MSATTKSMAFSVKIINNTNRPIKVKHTFLLQHFEFSVFDGFSLDFDINRFGWLCSKQLFFLFHCLFYCKT